MKWPEKQLREIARQAEATRRCRHCTWRDKNREALTCLLPRCMHSQKQTHPAVQKTLHKTRV